MGDLQYFDRATNQIKSEQIYGKFFLEALYGNSFISQFFSLIVLPFIVQMAFFSKLYGKMQKRRRSRKKILPFIEKFHIDASEFLKPPEEFCSFNDFFIRRLKPSCRPIAKGDDIAVLPADGRFLFYPKIDEAEGCYVKGKKFDLRSLLQDDHLFDCYKEGSVVIGRLCPTDYHRFHFPFDCMPTEAKLIKGALYSVNPIAIRKYISIFHENKRMLTELETKIFGRVLFVEVGATFVGSIHQTYSPNTKCLKGEEKGYFEFGGSCILLFFPFGKVKFDETLIQISKKHIEVKAKMGEPFGQAYGD